MKLQHLSYRFRWDICQSAGQIIFASRAVRMLGIVDPCIEFKKFFDGADLIICALVSYDFSKKTVSVSLSQPISIDSG